MMVSVEMDGEIYWLPFSVMREYLLEKEKIRDEIQLLEEMSDTSSKTDL